MCTFQFNDRESDRFLYTASPQTADKQTKQNQNNFKNRLVHFFPALVFVGLIVLIFISALVS